MARNKGSFDLYDPYANKGKQKNHFILKTLFKFIVNSIVFCLLVYGVYAGLIASGIMKTKGGIEITFPWTSFTIGDYTDNEKKPGPADKNKKETTDGTDKKTTDKTEPSGESTDASNGNMDANNNANGLSDIERQITDYKPEIGSDGTYRNAANEIVKFAGAEIKWNLNDIPCEGTASSSTVAIYCSTTPDVIYVNESHQDYETFAKNGVLIDSVKHELAHRAIDQHCRTTDPDIAKGRTEAIANSYAVLYYGANVNSFNNTGNVKTPLAYVPDEESNEMAKQVHSGACSANTDDGTGTTHGSTGNVGAQ